VETNFTRNGQFGLFTENLANDLDVFRTVLHTLFPLRFGVKIAAGSVYLAHADQRLDHPVHSQRLRLLQHQLDRCVLQVRRVLVLEVASENGKNRTLSRVELV
jgi:hypothetical protein